MSEAYDRLMHELNIEESQVVYNFKRRDGSLATILCRTKDHLGAIVYYRILREVELTVAKG